MIHLAFTLTDAGAWVALITGACGAVGSLVISIISAIRQGRTTKEVKKNTEEVKKVGEQATTAAAVAVDAAKLVAEVKVHQEESVQRRDEKLEEIHQEIRENTTVSRVAFREANDVNAKLAVLHESTLAAAEAAKAATTKIE